MMKLHLDKDFFPRCGAKPGCKERIRDYAEPICPANIGENTVCGCNCENAGT